MTELPGFYRGDDHTIRVEFRNKADNSLVDVSGWQFTCTMKLSSESPDSEGIQVTYTAHDNPVPSMVGVALLSFTSRQTRNLLPTKYEVDIEKRVNGFTQTVVKTKILIKPDVTRG